MVCRLDRCPQLQENAQGAASWIQHNPPVSHLYVSPFRQLALLRVLPLQPLLVWRLHLLRCLLPRPRGCRGCGFGPGVGAAARTGRCDGCETRPR